jgi:hypothetical protein
MLSHRNLHVHKQIRNVNGQPSTSATATELAFGYPANTTRRNGIKENHVSIVPAAMKRLTLKRTLTCFGFLSFLLALINFWGHQQLLSSSNPLIPGRAAILPQQQIKINGIRQPTHHACDGYNGIYHIEKGDIGGAAGTVFFQFVIGQVMWAEKYNFKPWVYLNNVSYVIYDPLVHGKGPGVNVTMKKGMGVSYLTRPMGHRRDAYPGPPAGNPNNLQTYDFHFDGDGVWENYFEPISDFVPGDKSCEDKPLVTMDLYLVTPGVHGFAPWAPKCWRYHYLPDYITKPHQPINEWLEPQRHSAHSVLKRYIRFLPHIKDRAESANPDCSMNNACLGIHIRQSDKAAGRRQIGTDEFLPYVEAFLQAGGKWVYLATDSGKHMNHIKREWPEYVRKIIRSMGDDVVRSNDFQAVFDIGSHHRTNTEILIEILALSKCQFMIHGFSAVTESSIWINVDLHYTSVNLEDPEHLDERDFGDLVGRVLNGGNATQIMLEKRPRGWWTKHETFSSTVGQPSNEACNDVKGILHISHVGQDASTGTAFFTSVLNQLVYAEQYRLKPWIHLNDAANIIFDDEVHNVGEMAIANVPDSWRITTLKNEINSSLIYPGPPEESKLIERRKSIVLQGNGVWSSYFRQVSDFIPGDKSCTDKPILSMDNGMVTPGLNAWTPWAIKAWQYDLIPDVLWKPKSMPLNTWLEPMRRKAHEIVKKYYHFHPFIIRRAQEVNPVNSSALPCLAVHLRNSDKDGIHRDKFPPNKFRNYFSAFARAGGKDIYVASDTHTTLEYISEHFPAAIRQMIRSQGPYVVRSSWKWPIHMLEKHHRANSEALVDILAMSKCQLLLHGSSTVSEAAIYLNLNLHNQSVNWEDPDKMDVAQFEALARRVLGTVGEAPVDLAELEKQVSETDAEATDAVERVRIIRGDEKRQCRRNAIVYLAQKKHSSYGRDSFGILLESLKLMNTNYLSLGNHRENTDVIIFHTADFTREDLKLMESNLGSDFRAALQFVDLSNTTYWQRPSWHRKDNPLQWYGEYANLIYLKWYSWLFCESESALVIQNVSI